MEPNYKIIGGDGQEYGPSTAAELQAWIREGRVGSFTQVWRDDTRRWSPASCYQELDCDLRASAPPPAVQIQPRHAGFWTRLGAYIIDRMLLSLALLFVWSWIVSLFGMEAAPPPPLGSLADLGPYVEAMGWQIAVAATLHLVYDVYFNGRFGATPGKMAVGVRIVRIDEGPINYKIAFVRWWAARLSDITLYLGYVMVVFREDKRALHDLLAGTQVIFKK
jgi:uncharacterized RDD family membrane protein YckC